VNPVLACFSLSNLFPLGALSRGVFAGQPRPGSLHFQERGLDVLGRFTHHPMQDGSGPDTASAVEQGARDEIITFDPEQTADFGFQRGNAPLIELLQPGIELLVVTFSGDTAQAVKPLLRRFGTITMPGPLIAHKGEEIGSHGYG
jgi:hypothetical protein